MNGSCDLEVRISSKTARQQGFLDKFQELFSLNKTPGITLTNVYKEMPITHPAFICQVQGQHVELQTCELQLAAISQCREAYIQSPLFGSPILGQLDSLDIGRGMVRLSDFSFRELYIERRATVRTSFTKPISIVALSGTNKISGVINDISLGGCCMNTLVREELEQSREILIELKLMAQSIGQALSMQIPGRLLRISGDAPPFKCAFSFNHTQESEQLLSIYMSQRQSEILKELRDSLKKR
jgi:hypothetical protein